MTTIEHELARLASVLESVGHPIKLSPSATDASVQKLVDNTTVLLDPCLQQLWQLTNGSSRTHWFAVAENELDFTPYEFMSVEQTLGEWNTAAPYDAATYAEWYDDESWGERDLRIQRHFLRHSKWIPFAEFNGDSHIMYIDGDPTHHGALGQIINYIHDPDGVFWQSADFLTFFMESNDMLEKCLAHDAQLVIDQLWLEH